MMNFHTHGDEGNTVPLQLLAETVDYKYLDGKHNLVGRQRTHMVGKSQVVEVGVGVVMALPLHYRKKMMLPVVAPHLLGMDFLLVPYLEGETAVAVREKRYCN